MSEIAPPKKNPCVSHTLKSTVSAKTNFNNHNHYSVLHFEQIGDQSPTSDGHSSSIFVVTSKIIATHPGRRVVARARTRAPPQGAVNNVPAGELHHR
jgi:hypothetical protein